MNTTASVNSALFSKIPGQERVHQSLCRALQQNRISHAYLFLGAPGSGKAQTAAAFAQALVCSEGACAQCEDCRRAQKQTHPDIKWYKAEGLSSYLLEQIREIIDDAQKAPIRAARKVYVLEQAELLSPACANAFLKTLEEPQENCCFILLASSRHMVLPTIISRCQVLPFVSLDQRQTQDYLAKHCNVDEAQAALALALSACSCSQAEEFLRDRARQELRLHALEVLSKLKDMADYRVLKSSQELIEEISSVLEDLVVQQKDEQDKDADFISKTALKDLQTRHKRELGAQERLLLFEILNAYYLVISDTLKLKQLQDYCCINSDQVPLISQLKVGCSIASLLKLLSCIEECKKRLSMQISPRLAFDILLFEMREVMTCP